MHGGFASPIATALGMSWHRTVVHPQSSLQKTLEINKGDQGQEPGSSPGSIGRLSGQAREVTSYGPRARRGEGNVRP